MKKMIHGFQKTMFVTLIIAFVLAAIPIVVLAQEEPTVFAVVEYMKAKPENEGKYLDLEKTFWKPVHQERINQGSIIGWILYGVHYTGSDDPYNYVTVTLFDNPDKMEDSWTADPAKVHPGQDIDKAFQETLKRRELVKRNMIMRRYFAYPEGGPGAFKYIEVDYMKVQQGMDDLYLDMEMNVWKPVHEEFIKAGARAGWSLWSCQFPGGYGMDYQYATVNYFSDFSKIGAANYSDAFNKAFAGKDVDALMEKTLKSRILVRSELWEVLDLAMKEQ